MANSWFPGLAPNRGTGCSPVAVKALNRFQPQQYQPVGTAVAGAPPLDGPSSLVPSPRTGGTPNPVFDAIETAIQRTFNSQQPGQRNDWREVEGAFVLFPPNNRPPEAVVHFLGGAFVGAAPQITYRLFLEALVNRNVLVIATPYGTNLDHLRSADECQFKFDRALRAVGPEFTLLPTYGIGHSLGCVIQLLICSRYAVKVRGSFALLPPPGLCMMLLA